MNYNDILPYIEKGLVSDQGHFLDPDVRILNYTQKCQFEQAWDPITKQCRGLILHRKSGKILAKPFPKFFNYGEHVVKGMPLPTSKFEVWEKLDGSLGILYALDGKPWIATRGSFVSEQAQWATKWWRDNVAILPSEGETNLFEIIYPENRIVIHYDFKGLVHLVSLDTETGRRIPRHWGSPVAIPTLFHMASPEELATHERPNEEGYVLFYPEENVRVKIKFNEYVRLHKLITGVSEIAIWEHLKEGKTLDDLLEKVPDEFFKWVRDVEGKLRSAYQKIEQEARTQFAVIDMRGTEATRKDWALKIQKMTNPNIGFAMLDNKDYSDIIWRMIRPKGQSQFKVDIDL